jgi:hypothetical protein
VEQPRELDQPSPPERDAGGVDERQDLVHERPRLGVTALLDEQLPVDGKAAADLRILV